MTGLPHRAGRSRSALWHIGCGTPASEGEPAPADCLPVVTFRYGLPGKKGSELL